MRSKSSTFTFKLLTSTFDLITDWLLYYEVSGIEQGLVFGQFSDAVLGLLILFCCVGTLNYIAELVLNLLDKCAANDDLLPTGLLDNINLASLWIEDVPLILMSVYIAGCRDTAVTVILLVKGLSTLLEVLVNACVIINKHIKNKTHTEVITLDGNQAPSWINIPVIIGLFVMLGGSLVLFGIGNFVTSSRNVIQLPSPYNFSSSHYKGEKYLDRSGLYLNSGEMFIMNSNDWIKLADLTNITSSQAGTLVVSITYDSNPNTRLWIQTTSSNDLSSPESSSCYSTQSSPLSVLTTCSTDFQFASTMTSFVFKFVYEFPSSRKPLGDIFYNYNIISFLHGRSCWLITAMPVLSLRYFKANPNVDDDMPLITLNDTTVKYYQTGSVLRAASEVWMTGIFQCCSTGKYAPTYDSSISVPGLGLYSTQTTTPCTTTTTPTIPTTTTLGTATILHLGSKATSNTNASITPTTTTIKKPSITTTRSLGTTTSTPTKTSTSSTITTTTAPDSIITSNLGTTTTTLTKTSTTLTTTTISPTITTNTTPGSTTTTNLGIRTTTPTKTTLTQTSTPGTSTTTTPSTSTTTTPGTSTTTTPGTSTTTTPVTTTTTTPDTSTTTTSGTTTTTTPGTSTTTTPDTSTTTTPSTSTATTPGTIITTPTKTITTKTTSTTSAAVTQTDDIPVTPTNDIPFPPTNNTPFTPPSGFPVATPMA